MVFESPTVLSKLQNLYNMTKYKALKTFKRPVLIANSADQSQETLKKTKEVGFDTYIGESLSIPIFEGRFKIIFDKAIKETFTDEFKSPVEAKKFIELMEREISQEGEEPQSGA